MNLGAALVGLVGSSLLGAQGGHAVELAWVRAAGAESCISRQELATKLTQRLGKNPFDGPANQWIEGFVARDDAGWVVQLFERGPEGSTLGTRTLRDESESCRELDDAIVLAVSLLIDPDAGTGSAEPSAPGTSGQPNAETTAPAASPAPSEPPTSLASIAEPRQEPTPCLRRPCPTPPGVPLRVLPGAAVVSGLVPGWAPSGEILVESTLASLLHFRGGVWYIPEQIVSSENGKLGLSLSTLELGACVADIPRAPVGPLVCATGLLGITHSAAYSGVARPPLERVWAGLRIDAGLGARVSGPVWFEARGLMTLPFVRDRYQVSGQPYVFQQPSVAFGAAVALGIEVL